MKEAFLRTLEQEHNHCDLGITSQIYQFLAYIFANERTVFGMMITALTRLLILLADIR